MNRLIIFIVLFFSVANYSSAQKYNEMQLRTVLDSLSLVHKGLNNKLQLNVTNLSLSELVSSVALENNLNVSIDPSLNQTISYNFFDAQVKDMLVFLYLNFEVEYEFVGSILSIRKRIKEVVPVVIRPKELDISYNPGNEFLSMDLKNDSLWKVTEKITRITGRNFVVNPEIRNKQVNAFLQNRPIDQVLDMFVKSNSLQIDKDSSGYYLIYAPLASEQSSNGSNGAVKKNGVNRTINTASGDFYLIKNSLGNLDIKANGIPINEIVFAAAEELGIHYVQYSKLDGNATLELSNVNFDNLMNRLFSTTNYSARLDDGIYIIGENKQEGIRKTELLRLENRTIESVKVSIPKELLTGLDVNEFVELNALIVTGNERQILELKSFISSIDVVVPMVQIDVMLLYSDKKATVNTGLKAILGTEPVSTNGQIFPEINNLDVGSSTINNILSAINGFGVVNLGKVTENFYLNLTLLESNSVIDIESTPKISTLNGHEAKVTIGETTYYQEQQLSFQPINQSAGFQQNSKIWKSLAANLSVTIKPFVSADEYVTLTITVSQQDFGAKVDPTAPPNLTNQTFESVIRVKNGEVILLGGLEKKQVSNSGSGTPILSRIPILKWFFSSREKTRDKSKLHLIVRPTVTY